MNTIPAGAQLELSNGLVGTSPASFELSGKSALVIKITKDGYEPVEVVLVPRTRESDVWLEGRNGGAGNMLFSECFGTAVLIEADDGRFDVTLMPLLTGGEDRAEPPSESTEG
jgi:hypothetical protein